MSRYDLTDIEWRVIEPLLPNRPRGVPRVDDRRVLNGIFWVLRSGAPWRDLPERFGPRTTCYNRFARWRKAGVWDRLMDAIAAAPTSSIIRSAAAVMLTPKQTRFVEEYLVDLNGKQAAIRAGYSPKTAEVQASRLLRNAKVEKALEAAMLARSKRTEVSADHVVNEFARIAFANMRDYWPRPGETIDLHRLDQDRTAAVEEIVIHESVDPSGVLHRHIRLKLRDKQRALDSLARHLGIFTDGVGHKSSIEARVSAMSPEERVACAEQLLESAQKYLPQYEEWERKRSREG